MRYWSVITISSFLKNSKPEFDKYSGKILENAFHRMEEDKVDRIVSAWIFCLRILINGYEIKAKEGLNLLGKLRAYLNGGKPFIILESLRTIGSLMPYSNIFD